MRIVHCNGKTWKQFSSPTAPPTKKDAAEWTEYNRKIIATPLNDVFLQNVDHGSRQQAWFVLKKNTNKWQSVWHFAEKPFDDYFLKFGNILDQWVAPNGTLYVVMQEEGILRCNPSQKECKSWLSEAFEATDPNIDDSTIEKPLYEGLTPLPTPKPLFHTQ